MFYNSLVLQERRCTKWSLLLSIRQGLESHSNTTSLMLGGTRGTSRVAARWFRKVLW